MKKLLHSSILLVILSCNNKSTDQDFVEYVDGRQLLSVNKIKRNGDKIDEPKINKIVPDSVRVGDQLMAKIFLSETEQVIADAFVNCQNIDNASVDTTTYKVSGCELGLIVKDDTIQVAFKPTSSGIKRFSEITILTRDRDKVFRTMNYAFEYKVVEN